MTDKELIKAEIERLKAPEISEDKEYAQYELDVKCGYDMALDDILSFINSLPEELVSEDLEEVAKYYIPDESYHMIIESKEEGSGENVYDYVQMIDMFKAGAQWQKEQMMKSVLASQEMTCIQVAHRLIGSSWNLACPTDKIGLKSNDKVKVIIIKDEQL